MAKNYLSNKISLFLAEQFSESFYEPEPASVGYVFIGRHYSYSNELNPDEILENSITEMEIWKNIFAAKKIKGSDIQIVIPSRLWQRNIVYTQYDDSRLLTTSDNFYVHTEVIISGKTIVRVYKCLNNGKNSNSTVRPTVNYSQTNGIQQTADGYIWKFMYEFESTNKFYSLTYMPVPLNIKNSGYGLEPSKIVDGAIYALRIENSGNNYQDVIKTGTEYSNFLINSDKITLTNTTNVFTGMAVSGKGIFLGGDGTHVTGINGNEISLSKNTISSVVSTGNNLTFSTRILITGNGKDAKVNSIVINSTTGAIENITMKDFGSGYTDANVWIYGRGTNASIKAIMGPKFGHGYYPAEELSANSTMISVIFGNEGSDSTISPSTKIRQIGLLVDPHKYGSNVSLTKFSSSSNTISQTFKCTLVPGSNYNQDEIVYQGSTLSNCFFRGIIHSQDSTLSLIQLTNVEGNFVIGESVKGNTSLVTRIGLGFEPPDLQPYTGNILYVENDLPIQRIPGQIENIKFVINF